MKAGIIFSHVFIKSVAIETSVCETNKHIDIIMLPT